MTDPTRDDGAVPVVPGYRTERLLGFGATGEVWAAVADDGDPVALKVVRRPEEDTERILAETALLRRLHHPHVVRLRTVARVPGHGPVLVLDRALGGSLAALVAARGPLDVGEVVTLVTPLAEALADLHHRGVVHGDVAPGNVLFDGAGRPLLGDLSVAAVVGQGPGERHGTPGYADPAVADGDPLTPAADVYGLAAVAWLALTGRAPLPTGERPPLVAVAPEVPLDLALVLEQALDADPARRPSPRELAGRCFAASPATPVRLVPTDPSAAPAEVVTHRLRAAAVAAPSAPPARRRHLLRRDRVGLRRLLRLGSALVGSLVVVGALVVGALVLVAPWPGGGEPPPPVARRSPAEPTATAATDLVPPAVTTALTGEDPAAAVPALAWLRARGLSTGDADLLARASVPGSRALADDTARLHALRSAGVVLAGLGFDVRAVTLVRRDGDVAVVEATVVTSAHRQVDDAGGVVAEVPGDEPRTSRLVLRRGDDGWRVESVA